MLLASATYECYLRVGAVGGLHLWSPPFIKEGLGVVRVIKAIHLSLFTIHYKRGGSCNLTDPQPPNLGGLRGCGGLCNAITRLFEL